MKMRPIPVYPQQADFCNSKAWLTGFVGGRGTGKTRIGAYRVQRDAKGGQEGMCVSPDAGVAHETTLPTFLKVTQDCGTYLDHKLSPYPKVWWRTTDGGTAAMVFRSAEKPKKLHGPNMAWLWLDEASLQSVLAFEAVIPTLRHEGYMGPCLMTFTPKGRANWTFEKFFTPIEIDQIAPDGTGVDDDGRRLPVVWMQGKPYLCNFNTKLIHAKSTDNPFLPAEFYDNIRANYSQRLADQELGGEFLDVTGLMFQREWFDMVDEAPRDAMRVRYWDKAATPGAGSHTAGVLVARTPRGLWYVEDVVRGQWSYHARDVIIKQTAERDAHKYGGEVIIVAEQEGGSGGKEVAHQMITNMAEYPVFKDVVGGRRTKSVGGEELPGEAKVVRALPLSAQAEAGNVRLVRGPWNAAYIEELIAFPEYVYSDQVDATSGAVNKLAGKMFTAAPPASKQKVEATEDTGRFGVAAALEQVRSRRHKLYGKE